MVVKDKVGRHRYILFKNNNRSREQILKEIKKSPVKLKIVFYSNGYTIVKCKHTDKEKAISFLNDSGLETVKTSGTIKKLKKLIGFGKSQPASSLHPTNNTFFIAFLFW